MSRELETAAQMVRESVNSLPAYADGITGRWASRGSLTNKYVGYQFPGSEGYGPVVEAYNPDQDEPVMNHIARLASPDVAFALADHLLALQAWQDFDDQYHGDATEDWANSTAHLRYTARRLASLLARDVEKV